MYEIHHFIIVDTVGELQITKRNEMSIKYIEKIYHIYLDALQLIVLALFGVMD